MKYVISDIHGEYDKFVNILKKINFNEDDFLYVLGDIVDRGPAPVKVLNDIKSRDNVCVLLGNHEVMAIDVLSDLIEAGVHNFEEIDLLPENVRLKMLKWETHGGDTTLNDFSRLSHCERVELLDFMKSFKLFTEIKRNDGKNVILVHAGLGNYSDSKKLCDYTVRELTLMRPDFNRIYCDGNTKIIVGHTPTISINLKPEIYNTGNVTFIDCGAAYNGRLCCLCLDTMRAYYE